MPGRSGRRVRAGTAWAWGSRLGTVRAKGGVVEQGSRQARRRWRWRARRTRLLRKSGGGGGGVPSVLQAQVGPVQRAGQGPRR